MADLPPLPADAMQATAEAYHDLVCTGVASSGPGCSHGTSRALLAAAYPHLAAAVLRWAARTTDEQWSELGVETPAGLLRRLADEVAP